MPSSYGFGAFLGRGAIRRTLLRFLFCISAQSSVRPAGERKPGEKQKGDEEEDFDIGAHGQDSIRK
jgi:hypothetical protein